MEHDADALLEKMAGPLPSTVVEVSPVPSIPSEELLFSVASEVSSLPFSNASAIAGIAEEAAMIAAITSAAHLLLIILITSIILFICG